MVGGGGDEQIDKVKKKDISAGAIEESKDGDQREHALNVVLNESFINSLSFQADLIFCLGILLWLRAS